MSILLKKILFNLGLYFNCVSWNLNLNQQKVKKSIFNISLKDMTNVNKDESQLLTLTQKFW